MEDHMKPRNTTLQLSSQVWVLKPFKIAILLAFISCLQVYTEPQEPTTLFLGNIKFPKYLNHADLCIYYKGQKLKTDWDKNNSSVQYSFLESKTSQSLYLLVCDTIEYTTKLNTIQNLKLTNDQYRCYHFQATRVHNCEEKLVHFSWNCQECELENGVIPDNTVIFLFDPYLIDGVLVHSWSKDQAMRLIPTINISSSATNSEIVRTIAVSRLTGIDIDTIHTKEKSKNNSSISGT